jgi:tRNA (guanine-N(7)-)-methyltransferase subunit TRM82
MMGKIKAEVEIWSTVQQFIKVDGSRKGRGWDEDGKPIKRKDKAKGDRSEGGGEAGEVIGEASLSADNITSDTPQANTAEPGEIIQVVHKIDSLDSGTGKYVLFSAVGSVFGHFFLSPSYAINTQLHSATAIFIFPFDHVTTLSSPPSMSIIRHFDFERPVLDFVMGSDGLIWVLLDGQWDNAIKTWKMVRVIRWDPVAEEVCTCLRLSQRMYRQWSITHLGS